MKPQAKNPGEKPQVTRKLKRQTIEQNNYKLALNTRTSEGTGVQLFTYSNIHEENNKTSTKIEKKFNGYISSFQLFRFFHLCNSNLDWIDFKSF